MYGVVQSGDHVGRTCVVKWFKLRPSGDDVEVRSKGCAIGLDCFVLFCFLLLASGIKLCFVKWV